MDAGSLDCTVCSEVCKRAVIVTCCNARACRACAVKQITKDRKCWRDECGKALATKDMKNDENTRENIEMLTDVSIINCSLCGEICKRGVSLRCCGVRACRECGVKKITSTRKCWDESCSQAQSTSGLINDTVLRAAVDHFKKNDVLDWEHIKLLKKSIKKVVPNDNSEAEVLPIPVPSQKPPARIDKRKNASDKCDQMKNGDRNISKKSRDSFDDLPVPVPSQVKSNTENDANRHNIKVKKDLLNSQIQQQKSMSLNLKKGKMNGRARANAIKRLKELDEGIKKTRSDLEKMENSSETEAQGFLILPNSQSILQKKLDSTSPFVMAVVGLEFLVEIPRGPVHCQLCDQNEKLASIFEHLQSAIHRLNYIEKFFPTLHKKFQKAPNLKNWGGDSFRVLEKATERIEASQGRLRPITVVSEDAYNKNLEKIRTMIQDGQHFSEKDRPTIPYDFDSLPDPFPVQGRPESDVEGRSMMHGRQGRNRDQGLDHIGDPRMKEQVEQEIQQFRDKQRGDNFDEGAFRKSTGFFSSRPFGNDVTAGYDQGKMGIGRDDRDEERQPDKSRYGQGGFDDFSRRPGLETGRDARGNETYSRSRDGERYGRRFEESDDRRFEERDDRRFEERDRRFEERDGRRDEQMDGKRDEQMDGRRDEQMDGRRAEQMDGRRAEQMDGRRAEQMDGRRAEQMDGRRAEQMDGRRAEQMDGRRAEQMDGRRAEQMDGRRDEQMDGRRDEQTDGRRFEQVDGRRGEEREMFSRREIFSKREERDGVSRRDPERDLRRNGDRERDGRRDGDRERLTEREIAREKDRTRRDRERMGRSPLREERRNRSPLSERKRKRSVSPYSAAVENFKRFKQAEDVMLEGIRRKNEIFDKRPEDHPKYPQEWRTFWHKRYSEVQAEGKDPNTHDYNTEWVPFWKKRVSDLIDEEVLKNQKALMKQFGLNSVQPPKRDQFMDTIDLCSDSGTRDVDPMILEQKTRTNDDRRRSDRQNNSSINRNRSPSPRRSSSKKPIEKEHADVQLIPALRLLSTLDADLGNLGPELNKCMVRAMNEEQEKEGGSHVLLDDEKFVALMESVKGKLNDLIETGLLDEAKEHVVQLCLDHLTKIVKYGKRPRSSSPASVLSIQSKKDDVKDDVAKPKEPKEDTTDTKAMIAESIATVLMFFNCGDIMDYQLEMVVEMLMRKTAKDDKVTPAGKLANEFVSTLSSTESLITSLEGLPQKHHAHGEEAMAVPEKQVDDDVETNDVFNDLTDDELVALLSSFKALSKTEKLNLVSYMKNLEKTNPMKVKMLRSRVGSQKAGDGSKNVNNYSFDNGSRSVNPEAQNRDKRGNDSFGSEFEDGEAGDSTGGDGGLDKNSKNPEKWERRSGSSGHHVEGWRSNYIDSRKSGGFFN